MGAAPARVVACRAHGCGLVLPSRADPAGPKPRQELFSPAESVFVDFRAQIVFFHRSGPPHRNRDERIDLGAKTASGSDKAACCPQPPPFTTIWSTPPHRACRCYLVPPPSHIRFPYTLPDSSCVYIGHSTSPAASCSERPRGSHRRGFAGVAPRRSLPLTHVILLYMS